MKLIQIRYLLLSITLIISLFVLFITYYFTLETNSNPNRQMLNAFSKPTSTSLPQRVLNALPGCKPTTILIGSNIDTRNCNSTVLTRTVSSWRNEDDICKLDTSDFVKTTLKSPAGFTPIYVYSKTVDQWVSGNVINQGMWERGNVELMYHFMNQNKNLDFIDLGANIGVYGLTFAKMGRRVILIDPLLGNVKRLCKSVREGHFPNEVYVIHNAISDKRFTVGFGKYKGNVGGTYIKEVTSGETEVAQAILLDDLLEIFNFTSVVMKIDVETHETRALLGGDKFFSTVNVTVVQVEWNSHKQDGIEIIKFLTKHNMKPYRTSVNGEVLDTTSFDKWPGDILWKKG